MITTDWVIILIAVVAIVYDLFIMATKGVSWTISVRLLAWSKLYPIIPFSIGVLMGHLFFSIH